MDTMWCACGPRGAHNVRHERANGRGVGPQPILGRGCTLWRGPDVPWAVVPAMARKIRKTAEVAEDLRVWAEARSLRVIRMALHSAHQVYYLRLCTMMYYDDDVNHTLCPAR